MRDGYRIIDSDTHVGPNVETLQIYAGPRLRERWSELEQYYQPVTEGHHLSIGPYPFKRPLRTGEMQQQVEKGGKIPLKGNTSLNFVRKPVPEVNNLNAQGRLEDMDVEGVDVHLLIPATFANAATVLDDEIALELYGAYHRYLDDYCSVDPNRLKAGILAAGVDPDWTAKQIRDLAGKPWVGAVIPVLPEGMPVDDPRLNPIWEAMNDNDLPILHHSFFYEPPYFPGYRDVWGNLAIARAAAHPWGAQRLLAYVLLSGMFDEYPNIRIGFAECSSGWLAGWLNRLDYQQEYLSRTLPETKLTPTEYARAGRVFCGTELDEGEEITQSVMSVLGDGVLMYSSDYPHGGSKFPTSPDVVLGWSGLGEVAMRKFLATNCENYLRM